MNPNATLLGGRACGLAGWTRVSAYVGGEAGPGPWPPRFHARGPHVPIRLFATKGLNHIQSSSRSMVIHLMCNSMWPREWQSIYLGRGAVEVVPG